MSIGRDPLADGPPGGPDSSPSEPTTSPPSSPSPSPSPSPPPRPRQIPFNNEEFSDLAYYAERSHLSDLADPEWASLEQWRKVHPELDPRTVYNTPEDPVSRRFTILADAARIGHRSGEYAAPAVENIGGYIERAMKPLMEEIEVGINMAHLDEAAIEEADKLVTYLEHGVV